MSKPTRLIRACSLALIGLSATGAGAGQPAEPLQREDLEAFVRGYVEQAMAERGIPGVTLSVVKDGQVLLESGYGFADLEDRVAVDAEKSVFRVGSISKTVTATAALIAVEDGQLALDQDLRPAFADLPLRPSFPGPITLHHLLTFTGGFDEVLFGQHAATVQDWRPLGAFLRDELPPRFAPAGEVSAYNDFQTSLAGLAVERASGLPFERYAEERVFEPLGMDRSSFEQLDMGPVMETWRAHAYSRDDGEYSPYPRDYVMTTPAAGLWTTAADMRRYLLALLGHVVGDDDAPLLSESVRMAQMDRQFAHHEELRGWTYGLAERFYDGHRRYLFKDGQATGFHARMVLVPDQDLGIFVAINRNILGTLGEINSAGRFNRDLTDMLLERVAFPDPAATDAEPPEEMDDPEPASRFLGTYRNTVQSRHTPERIITMMDDLRIREVEGAWTQVEPGLLQWHEGGPHFLAFGGEADGHYRYLFVGTGAYERVPWYGASHNTVRIGGGYLSLALMTLIAAAALLWRRKRAPRSERTDWDRGTAVHLLALAGLTAAIPLGIGAVMLGTDIQDFFKGFPWTFQAVLWLAIPAVVLEGLLLLAMGRAWLRGDGTPWVRVWGSLFALALLPYFPWLHHWNLLGPA